GRAVLGIGAGYLKPEFRALGVPFERRGARTDEAIDAIRALWSMEKPTYRGRFYAFEGIDAHPRPVQRPGPPIVVGGPRPGGPRGAVVRGNGWYGFALAPAATEKCLRGLERAASEVERPAGLGRLEITATAPPGALPDPVRRYQDAGAG